MNARLHEEGRRERVLGRRGSLESAVASRVAVPSLPPREEDKRRRWRGVGVGRGGGAGLPEGVLREQRRREREGLDFVVARPARRARSEEEEEEGKRLPSPRRAGFSRRLFASPSLHQQHPLRSCCWSCSRSWRSGSPRPKGRPAGEGRVCCNCLSLSPLAFLLHSSSFFRPSRFCFSFV